VEVFKGESGWDVTEAGAGKKAKKVRPSEINHGNIPPSVQPLGVTCDYLEHMFVLSFAALRRLHFGSPEKDSAGRTLLAALGLLAATEQDAAGYALRSRCDLVCEGISPLELVHPDGTTAEMTLNRTEAHDLYAEAFKAAKNSGFELQESPLKLMPQPKLVEIVRKSQELALEGKGGDEQSESNGNEG
jgi:CRISPR-associated protein Csb1